jgi:hypothetical protein
MDFMRCVLAYWAYIEYGDDDCLEGCERVEVIRFCLRWELLQQLPDYGKVRAGKHSPQYTRFTRWGRLVFALGEVTLLAWLCGRGQKR